MLVALFYEVLSAIEEKERKRVSLIRYYHERETPRVMLSQKEIHNTYNIYYTREQQQHYTKNLKNITKKNLKHFSDNKILFISN